MGSLQQYIVIMGTIERIIVIVGSVSRLQRDHRNLFKGAGVTGNFKSMEEVLFYRHHRR
jgi:hypothetical protein